MMTVEKTPSMQLLTRWLEAGDAEAEDDEDEYYMMMSQMPLSWYAPKRNLNLRPWLGREEGQSTSIMR